jgi:inositol polyphosphate 1-phosphatase
MAAMTNADVADLVQTLVGVAGRAAQVARAARLDAALQPLLVADKGANARFAVDFKTLADVLIQQMLVHALAPLGLGARVYGEESNRFGRPGGDGDSDVVVRVEADAAATAALLAQVLPGHPDACAALAAAVHTPAPATADEHDTDAGLPGPSLASLRVDLDRLACWVDPIDGTNEYVRGHVSDDDEDEDDDARLAPAGGLRVALVLVGLFDRTTGAPVLGVVHQPFHRRTHGGTWRGRVLWGGPLLEGSVDASALLRVPVAPPPSSSTGPGWLVLHSSGERAEVVERLLAAGCVPCAAPGCGSKVLAVVDGRAAACVLTLPTAYAWDTCALDALLRARGGGIVDAVAGRPLVYREGGQGPPCHEAGLVAYRDPTLLPLLLAACHRAP